MFIKRYKLHPEKPRQIMVIDHVRSDNRGYRPLWQFLIMPRYGIPLSHLVRVTRSEIGVYLWEPRNEPALPDVPPALDSRTPPG